MSELLIGCGLSRIKQMHVGLPTWQNLTTLDHEPRHEPDVLHDLEDFPYPFEDGQFSEIHAYEVLEHCGRQGDWRFFFGQWSEFHRILKDGGLFFGTVPTLESMWAWGDPSHTRVIPLVQLEFLSQSFYEQVGRTAASDFRSHWKGNLNLVHAEVRGDNQAFILRKDPL